MTTRRSDGDDHLVGSSGDGGWSCNPRVDVLVDCRGTRITERGSPGWTWHAMKTSRSRAGRQGQTPGDAGRREVDDLQSQLEALLDQVWRCEAAWRREDRVDRAIWYGSPK